jgi:hypothetical protein
LKDGFNIFNMIPPCSKTIPTYSHSIHVNSGRFQQGPPAQETFNMDLSAQSEADETVGIILGKALNSSKFI